MPYVMNDEDKKRKEQALIQTQMSKSKEPSINNPPEPSLSRMNGKPKVGMGMTATKPPLDKPASGNDTEQTSASITSGDSGKGFGVSYLSMNSPTAIDRFAAKNKEPAIGLGMPQKTLDSYSDRKNRENIIRQASTVQKGAHGLTANQLNVLAGMQKNRDGIKNDEYQAKLGMAGNLAQANIKEAGANDRALLGETLAQQKFNQRLGFDTKKFNASNTLEQEKLGIDAKKLNDSTLIDKYNAKTSRFNADTSRMAAETGRMVGMKKGQLTEVQRNERMADYLGKVDTIVSAYDMVSGMLQNEDGLKRNIGLIDAYTPNFNPNAKKFESDRNALLSQVYLATAPMLKGVLTDKDAAELKNAFGNLQDKTISEEGYTANLQTIQKLLAKQGQNLDTRYQDILPNVDEANRRQWGVDVTEAPQQQSDTNQSTQSSKSMDLAEIRKNMPEDELKVNKAIFE